MCQKDFLSAKESKELSPRTLQVYRYRLTVFARLHPELPTETELLEEFLFQTGPTPEIRETYFRLLRNLYCWLLRRRRITSNPAEDIEAPKLRRKIARALAPSEVHQFLAYPGHNPQLRAFLHLLANTGLRLSEAWSVNAADQFVGHTLVLNPNPPKDGLGDSP